MKKISMGQALKTIQNLKINDCIEGKNWTTLKRLSKKLFVITQSEKMNEKRIERHHRVIDFFSAVKVIMYKDIEVADVLHQTTTRIWHDAESGDFDETREDETEEFKNLIKYYNHGKYIVNDCGVVLNPEKVINICLNKKRPYVSPSIKIRIAKNPFTNKWHVGSSFSLKNCYCGSAVSFDRGENEVIYNSRQECIETEIAEMEKAIFGTEERKREFDTPKEKADANKLVAELQKYKINAIKQELLFA